LANELRWHTVNWCPKWFLLVFHQRELSLRRVFDEVATLNILKHVHTYEVGSTSLDNTVYGQHDEY
jgi:hypothetical protein